MDWSAETEALTSTIVACMHSAELESFAHLIIFVPDAGNITSCSRRLCSCICICLVLHTQAGWLSKSSTCLG